MREWHQGADKESKFAPMIMAGGQLTTGIWGGDSGHGRSRCLDSLEPRIISCGFMTAPPRRAIRDIRQRYTWIIRMDNDNILRQRHKVTMERSVASVPYSAKDFQLEVLDRLAEMRNFAEALDESWNKKLQAVKEQ